VRTRKQEVAVFKWLKPSAVAAVIDCDEDLIRTHIKQGDFPDVDGEPGAIDVGAGKRPEYRINPLSFEMFRKARKVAA
jgi:hypothetical protein